MSVDNFRASWSPMVLSWSFDGRPLPIEALALAARQFVVAMGAGWLAADGWASTSVVLGAWEANYNRRPYSYVRREVPATSGVFVITDAAYR